MKRDIKKEQFERLVEKTYKILKKHKGRENAIDMGELYYKVFEKQYKDKITDTRYLRKVITELRKKGYPVLASMTGGKTGYYIANSAEEIKEFIQLMEKRALKSLSLISKIKRISLPVYLGQLYLQLRNSI